MFALVVVIITIVLFVLRACFGMFKRFGPHKVGSHKQSQYNFLLENMRSLVKLLMICSLKDNLSNANHIVAPTSSPGLFPLYKGKRLALPLRLLLGSLWPLNKHGSLFCLCFCNLNSSNVIDLSLLLEVSGIMLFTNTYSDVSLLFVFCSNLLRQMLNSMEPIYTFL